MPQLLELFRITRRFGRVTALNQVDLRVETGQVYGILGENGAGKSTLMHILAGALEPTAGEIVFDSRKVSIPSPRRAFELGIGMVYQHFKLIGTQTGLENLAVYSSGSWFRGISPEIRRTTEKWLHELNWQVDMQRPVEQLSVSEQQRIEIIKALSLGGRLLILDEPTAALTPAQADSLLAAIRNLAQRGLTILLVSHKLTEVRQVCDRVMILRAGRVVLEAATAEVSTSEMIAAMIGKDIAPPPVKRAMVAGRNVMELIHDAEQSAFRHSSRLVRASLHVRSGEIVGICGVEGNGQLELISLLTGSRRVHGRLMMDGVIRQMGGVQRHLRRIGVIPADRQKDGLILPWSINYNLVLKTHDRRPFSRWGFLRRRCWGKFNEALKLEFDIRAANLQMPVAALSGGNQQKVIVARELGMKPGFLLAVNPTRGLDVGAAAFVMRELLAARDTGMGILLIHEDLDEVLRLSDRLYVIYANRLYATPWPDATREAVGSWMLGHGLSDIGTGDGPGRQQPVGGNGRGDR